MSFHTKLKQLRIEKSWTQAQLAEKLNVQQKQVSSYERGASKPSTEVLIRIAETFEVSLDYLVFELQGQSAKVNVKDRDLLRVF
ncbi:MAG: helix-turn-helix transcriptional regulator, partial [Planctomycetes bacterium]|nr:helix-turn-helix transcriptional regulator [Planctomycetota bacterium]